MEKSKKSFFRKCKFTNKHFASGKRNDLSDPEISSEIEKVILDDMEIAETFNEFFVNIVPSLKISPKENYKTDVGNDNEPILNYINKFKNHPSIKTTTSRKKEEQSFSFMFLMKKFLTKLVNYKLQQQYNKMIFQQKF